MKHLTLIVFSLFFVEATFSQLIYESPHVKDGKTFQYTIPKGYFYVENSDVYGEAMFATQEGLSYDELTEEEIGIGILMVMHEQADEETSLQIIQSELEKDLVDVNEGVIILEKPCIVQINGREFMRGGVKGTIEEEPTEGMYFGITRFGDYNIFLSYYAPEGITDVLGYESFKKILETGKEVAVEYDDEYDLEVYYQNNLFPTEISYYSVLPVVNENWFEPIDESGHLLSKFNYKDDNGSLSVFSGGSASNYSTDKEKANAIQLAMDHPTPMTLKAETGFSNEEHAFKLYTIVGGGTMSSVYTTEVNDELVFFVVDGGINPVPDFKPAVRDVMLTMWIDYFEGEE